MGSKGDNASTDSYSTPVVDNSAQVQASMSEYMNAMMQMNSASTAQIIESMGSNDLPEVTSYTDVDYDAENLSLQEKIDAQIEADDVKRRGVLGTVLSNEDDEDPETVTSSLLVGS